ncbi:AraC family transcriptional regulator [Maribacter hydrothermalis]|uniref:AraC family transcriptional regulator n=1 Tax=Maribacter hydrothermalis TaxID=1836467 RepID=A0A1B7ZBV2_9FLAO|nr:AraC family transcriptional regulator [Maribacter hydrothermalis]APQ15969.1 AraC family transcriptional regulator [Maribacter hydrothermalis]OBR40386.1 AraC family transcriptional regulator [Maribacter hydrothermalis]
MKSALKKSPIPETRAYLARMLSEPVFDPHWHFHSENQLFLVLKGSGTRFIGDSVKPYKAGDITFTGPNLPHLWRSENEEEQEMNIAWSEGVVIYFREDFLGKNILQSDEAIRLRQVFHKSLRGIEFTEQSAVTLKRLMLELLPMKGFDGILHLLKILNFISNTKEFKILASPGYTNTLREADTERMFKVYAYVMKNFKRKMTLTDLAKLTNMTPTSFSRYFKQHANKSFSEFVSEIRIGHACKLLIEKKMNVSQACYESGFQTLSNFNKQFKSITKRTPLSYKKEYEVY